MIISHSRKYVYLQPVGTDAHVGYMALRNAGLIDKDDICSGLHFYDIPLYEPQNFTPLSLDQYKEAFGFMEFAPTPIEQIMTFVNPCLTLKELTTLGYLTKQQIQDYTIFAFIRDPVDRFVSIFTESQTRRPICRDQLEIMFDKSLNKQFTHMLWQDQYPYHKVGMSVVSTPLLFSNFHQSIETMLNTLGYPTEHNKRSYAYSFGYNIDNKVIQLAKQRRQYITKIYKKDTVLWESVNDNI
jgi:hypothetical protein